MSKEPPGLNKQRRAQQEYRSGASPLRDMAPTAKF